MVEVLGLDIGGANTKAALLTVKKGKVLDAKIAVKYFPVWKEPENLASTLLTLKSKVGANVFDALGVTMTAELSDVYQTKREGVQQILGCVKTAFPNVPVFVLNTDAKVQPLEQAMESPLGVAAANWAGTGWLVSKHFDSCVVVDVGSTSTSIIPIVGGKVAAKGKTDLDKLIFGELVYTGSLRTNVAAIVQSIPIRGDVASVASEVFALSGDVHLVLGHIDGKDYSTETADGRGKTKDEALARLARVVCADTEMLSEKEIVKIAQHIYQAQVKQIAEALGRVYRYVRAHSQGKVPVVVTGLGRDFLARKAAESLHVDEVDDLGATVQREAVLATPAFAVAQMTALEIAGNT